MASFKLYLQQLQSQIQHVFKDTCLLEEAFTSRGAEGKEGVSDLEGQIIYDGNRKLAQLGEALVEFLIVDESQQQKGSSRKIVNDAVKAAAAKDIRVERAKLFEIHLHLKLDKRQDGQASSRSLSFAISAIIGATWRDSRDMTAVRTVMNKFGIGVHPSQYVDPITAIFGADIDHRQFAGEAPIVTSFIGSQPPLHSVLLPKIAEAASRKTSEISPPQIYLPRDDTISQHGPSLSLTFSEIAECRMGMTNIADKLDSESIWNVQNQGGGCSPILETEEIGLAAIDPQMSSCVVSAAPEGPLRYGQQMRKSSSLPTSATKTLSHGRSQILLTTYVSPTTGKDFLTLPDSLGLGSNDGMLTPSSISVPNPRKRKTELSSQVEHSSSTPLNKYMALQKDKCRLLGFPCPEQELATLLTVLPTADLSKSGLGHNLKIIYIGIASSFSIVALQKMLMVQRRPVTKAKHLHKTPLAIPERITAIERFNDNIAYYCLLKRCHVYQLFVDWSSKVQQTTDGFINNTVGSFPAQRVTYLGNPRHNEDSQICSNMMQSVYPELREGLPEYTKRRRQIRILRQLGERLDLLVNRFGYGILGLMNLQINELDDDDELDITDTRLLSIPITVFRSFVLNLDRFQGVSIRQISEAVVGVVEAIFKGDIPNHQSFSIEGLDKKQILGCIRGSPELIDLLTRPSFTEYTL